MANPNLLELGMPNRAARLRGGESLSLRGVILAAIAFFGARAPSSATTIFYNGFEEQNLCSWSSSTPAALCVGKACTFNPDCSPIGLCIDGSCTTTCGAGGHVASCNAPATTARFGVGRYGGVNTCWDLHGDGSQSLCWPNGSGQSCSVNANCPREGEACIGGVCQFSPDATNPRTTPRCLSDSTCFPGEACAIFTNLDTTDIRTDGACLWLDDGSGPRGGLGAPCTRSDQCGSFVCSGEGLCASLCTNDSSCGVGYKCEAGGIGRFPDEYAKQYVGACGGWPGSRSACSANSGCAAGEECAGYLQFVSSDTSIGLASACETFPQPAGAAVGGACATDDECKSGYCEKNPVTGLGSCLGWCPGGDVDCGGGTSCRSILYEDRDPSTATDDVRAPICVKTGIGQPCFANNACTVCASDDDCSAAEGVLCVKVAPADPTGICRDPLGRCVDPCVVGCSSCPAGTHCATVKGTNICEADSLNFCQRWSKVPVARYEHGMCGDVEYPLGGGGPLAQSDLCYYYGSLGGPDFEDIFQCGQACGVSCPDITTSSTPISTECRSVYPFLGEQPLSPDQCAPADAYAPPAPLFDASRAVRPSASMRQLQLPGERFSTNKPPRPDD